jgi:two-component system phosphate regulon response regulator PhoB
MPAEPPASSVRSGSGPPRRILVVDDEPDITGLVAYHLAKAGYRVTTAQNGSEALSTARQEHPDLVVLDLMLPGLSGYEVLQELRRRPETSAVGVILLTARKDEPDRIKGLALGADDYVAKPFSPQELVLRVAAVLRRLAAPAVGAGGVLSAGPITLDPHDHRVTVTGREVSLTATEFKLLRTMLERPGRVQTRTHLLQVVWQAQSDIQTRTVDMHVQRLRTKLGAAGSWIDTVRGVGYRFREPPATEAPATPRSRRRT